MSRTLAWIDGVNSAVMGKIMLSRDPSVIPVHVDLGSSVDEDSHRFIDDVERWYDKEVVRIRSTMFKNIDEVFEKRRYHAGINGEPCTGEMKFTPRLDFQLPSDTHLWGYTADKRDAKRFDNMVENYPELLQRAPLVELGLTKAMTHGILEQEGIRRPRVYDLGFPNGNCIGCVKATSPNYWAAVRLHFPDVFARRADQCRRFGSRLARLKGERIFIDEIPADWPTGEPIVASCDFICSAISHELEGAA